MQQKNDKSKNVGNIKYYYRNCWKSRIYINFMYINKYYFRHGVHREILNATSANVKNIMIPGY